MTLTNTLILNLFIRFTNIDSNYREEHDISFYKEKNWLSGVEDYRTQLQLVCLYEELSKLMFLNHEQSDLFQYLIFPLAKGFTIKFKRCYNAKSFVETLHKNFLSLNIVEPIELVDLQETVKLVLTNFMRQSDYLNYQMFEDFEHGQQIDKLCKSKQ